MLVRPTGLRMTTGGAGQGGRVGFGLRAEDLADQRELGRDAGVGAGELLRAHVFLRREARVHVAEVLVRRGVVRVELEGLLEGVARLVELALRSVQRGQVVVGLGELGEVLRELREGGDGLGLLVLLGEDHAAQEAHLRVARLAGDVGVGLGERFVRLALAQQRVHVVVFVGVHGGAPQAEQQCEGNGESGECGVLHEASAEMGEMPACGLGEHPNAARWQPFILGFIVAEGPCPTPRDHSPRHP